MMFNLAFWLKGKSLAALSNSAQQWWQEIENWFIAVSPSIDELEAPLILVNLLAWSRMVERLQDEPEALYRLRVKHAFANMVDAGSIAGLKRIFERLELHIIDIQERQSGNDWDVVSIQIADNTLSERGQLIANLVQTYGLTCRRYQYSIVDAVETFTGSAVNAFEHCLFTVRDKMAITKTDELTTYQSPSQNNSGFVGALDNVVCSVSDKMNISHAQNVTTTVANFSENFNNQLLTAEG